jgi:GNAT superfamily N-acetyltransferase
VWAEAQVPDVSEDERKHYEDLAASAWWNPKEGMDEIDAKNEVVMERILAERPYIRTYPRPGRVLTVTRLALGYLAVHPENQGKGIGTALVESGIQRAEKLRLPIFILAFRAGRGIYLRLGFRKVDRVIQDDTKYGGQGEYGAYFMVYDVPPKSKSREP